MLNKIEDGVNVGKVLYVLLLHFNGEGASTLKIFGITWC